VVLLRKYRPAQKPTGVEGKGLCSTLAASFTKSIECQMKVGLKMSRLSLSWPEDWFKSLPINCCPWKALFPGAGTLMGDSLTTLSYSFPVSPDLNYQTWYPSAHLSQLAAGAHALSLCPWNLVPGHAQSSGGTASWIWSRGLLCDPLKSLPSLWLGFSGCSGLSTVLWTHRLILVTLLWMLIGNVIRE
jgi:hypothetical protein